MGTRNIAVKFGRGLLAPGLTALMLLVPSISAAELPKTPEAMMGEIRAAIETHDYDALKNLVFWKGAGKIKKRIVRFTLYRALGRKIKSITWENIPADGFDALIATGKLAPNMEMRHAVRVVFDEEPLPKTGKQPTSVFPVGMRDGVYRIGLVNRAGPDDDGD